MLRRRSLLRLIGSAVVGGSFELAGCASPNPSLYALAPIPGSAAPGGPRVVSLRTIGLARYLERPQIVVSSEDYRLNVASNDWWGEPLGAMLGRILAQELAQRLPGSTVLTESGAITVEPDAVAEVNIQRLDEDRAGAVVLDAQLAVTFSVVIGAPTIRRSGRTDTRSLRLVVPAPTADRTGQVAASSAAIGQLADALATMLRGSAQAGV